MSDGALGRWTQRAQRLLRRESTAEPFTIEIDYPVDPISRHGWGRPPHPQLDALLRGQASAFANTLASFKRFEPQLDAIAVDWAEAPDPFWNNHWFQGLDIVALYCLVASRDAATCLEVGSGYSTRVARRAIRDHGLRTRILSIDPSPRASVVSVADEHVQSTLEAAELDAFRALEPGDILLFDGSHRAFTNSDVTVFFTEVLPILAGGVLVQVHDIFLPWDYRPDWSDRWYSEQYLLAAWLLAGGRLDVVLPNFFVSTEPELNDVLSELWSRLRERSANLESPSAFWFETRAG